MSKKFAASFILIYFLLGVSVAPQLNFEWDIVLITLISLFVLGVLFYKNRKVLILIFASLGMILGLVRFDFATPYDDDSSILSHAEKEVSLDGFVSGYPQKKEKTQTFYVDVVALKDRDNKREISGRIFVITSKLYDYMYGQNISLVGNLEKMENTDEFNFKEFFISRGVTAKMLMPEAKTCSGLSGNPIMRFLFNVRNAFEKKVSELFLEPFASLVLGLLLGVKTISDNLMETFNRVSLSHIIVVSGYNLSIIANFLKGLLRKKSRKVAFWAPLFGITLFVLFVGAEPPVVRAAIMAITVLLAKERGRKVDSVFILLFAAFVMVLFNPYILRYDPGFQLSFVSTLGILVFSKNIESFLGGIKIPRGLSELISSTLSAQLFILPLVVYYFDRVSLIGPISNFIVLPLIPIIMLLSFIAVLLGFLFYSISFYVSIIPTLLLLFVIKVSELLASIPFASIEIRGLFWIIPFFNALIFVLMILIKKMHYEKR